ncbi:MAG: hypothetical protein QGG36_24375 [Pirellulaceae bacterium]|nr:hypothetical protein [Pirellulaceae bacterium]MDP7018956.1 hypothetical protein [Pirellulaceae bacterium]
MSRTKSTVWLASLTAVLVMASTSWAQHVQPFIDPLVFDPDFQFFAPAELGDFGNPAPPNTGWFGKYDRMYIWITRPSDQTKAVQPFGTTITSLGNHTEGDYTWGNRWDFGYMTEENHGWLFSAIHIDGPSAANQFFLERINRFNTDDDPTDQNNQGGGQGGGQQMQADAVFPTGDRNNPLTDARDFLMSDSLNTADLSGFEFNKTFRLPQFHNGHWMEPLVGVRYIKFRDFHRRDYYRTFNSDPTMTAPQPNNTDDIEELRIIQSNWDNYMVGGQLGVRTWGQHSRWSLSNDLRVFALANFQAWNQADNIFTVLYDSGATDADVDRTTTVINRANANDVEFVWGLDIRAEAAFQFTRDISLVTGVQVMHFPQGVGRGDKVAFNEEDMTMAGLTFGVEINR